MKREDKERLGHIIDAIRLIGELDDGARDIKTRMAIERALSIIGEAANHVSASIHEQYDSIPWRKIIAYRHILIHAYFGTNEDTLWEIVDYHLGELEEQISAILSENNSNKGGE